MKKDEEAEIIVKDDKLILSSLEEPRKGWRKAFEAMAKAGDDELIAPEHFKLESDDDEWTW